MLTIFGFANRVRRLRHDRGLTQEQLAIMAGLPLTTVSRLDANPFSMPTLETAMRLAKALGVAIEELLTSEQSGVTTQ